jgi:hypothetical protein
LQRALQDAGQRADSGSLHFNLRGDGATYGHNQGQGANDQAPSGGMADGYAFAAPDEDGDAAAATYILTPGRVNLRV